MAFESSHMELNLNLWFKPTSFNLVARCISSNHIILPCHDHASYCRIALIAFFLCCRCLSPLSRHGFDDGIDDIDEELYYLQKCEASKTPSFIPIQSHPLASALFYCIRTTMLQLLPAAVVEPLSSAWPVIAVTAWFLALSFSFVFLRYLLEICGLETGEDELFFLSEWLVIVISIPRLCHLHLGPTPIFFSLGIFIFLLKE